MPATNRHPDDTKAARGQYAVTNWAHGDRLAVTPTAAEVAELVDLIAAYVTKAGGDWDALAANRPGWAAGCNEHHAVTIG